MINVVCSSSSELTKALGLVEELHVVRSDYKRNAVFMAAQTQGAKMTRVKTPRLRAIGQFLMHPMTLMSKCPAVISTLEVIPEDSDIQ